jgi:hypothetical protein
MSRSRTSPRRSLLLAAAIFFILALLPSFPILQTISSYAAEPARIALAPPSRVFTVIADFLRPPRSPDLAGDPAVREIENARDEYQRRWRASEQRIVELENLAAALQGGRSLLANIPYTPFATPVVERSTDPTSATLTVRGGRDLGVTNNAVASSASASSVGIHLIGRVGAVNARTSNVIPITHRANGWMSVIIDPDTTGDPASPTPLERLARAQIQPVGQGLFRGEVDADAPAVEVGQTVRLSDSTWPDSAQMLVLGQIVEIAPKDSQPLRTVITVRPELDLARVSQLFLWIPNETRSSETEAAR